MTIQQMMFNSSALAWAPTDIGSSLVAWWDAYDESTITYLSSNYIDRWYDKILITRYATNNAGGTTVSPTWSATARNSRPGVIFDGSDRLPISEITNFPTGTTDGCVFSVVYRGATPSWSTVISWGSTSGGSHRNVGINDFDEHVWDTWQSDSAGPSWPSSVDRLIYQEHELSVATDRSYFAINGALSKTTGSSAGSGNSTSTTRGVIGDNASAAQDSPIVGTIQEIFVFDAFLSDTDRYKLEGYCAAKWGLQSLLPSDHPYKAAPP